MRARLVLALILTAASLTAQAQEKSKTPPPARTYFESLDMSSGQAVASGFVEAYAASDYARAYLLLSPEAKIAFVTQVVEYNAASYFPDLPASSSLGGVRRADEAVGNDIIQEAYVDGALMFDRVMLAAEQADALPFILRSGTLVSPTFERETEARYIVGAEGTPGAVIITAMPISNGDWRVVRIVWAGSDPQASPWGFE